MFRGVFVTGTDTDVGKTVASAALMHRYRQGHKLRYWKPIQTGIEQNDDTATVRELGACEEHEVFDSGVRLPQPLSPHQAAALAHTRIELASVPAFAAKESVDQRWIVEGAGGVLVPINETDFMIDLMWSMCLPIVIVSRSGLGTINHTLLTIEALRVRSIKIAGIIMIGDKNDTNRQALESFGDVAILAEMPRFPTLTPDVLRNWALTELDPANELLKYFE